jgi:hypothetical protein
MNSSTMYVSTNGKRTIAFRSLRYGIDTNSTSIDQQVVHVAHMCNRELWTCVTSTRHVREEGATGDMSLRASPSRRARCDQPLPDPSQSATFEREFSLAVLDSGYIHDETLRRAHMRTLEVTKIAHFVLHTIRHTFLTRLGESGCDVWTLARIAGHGSIKVSSRYVHPSEDAVQVAMSRLGGHKTGHTAPPQQQPAVAAHA